MCQSNCSCPRRVTKLISIPKVYFTFLRNVPESGFAFFEALKHESVAAPRDNLSQTGEATLKLHKISW